MPFCDSKCHRTKNWRQLNILIISDPFTLEFLKQTIPLLNLGIIWKGDSVKIINRMANNVDPDETACNEPSHPDQHCLHINLYRSTGLK